MKIRCQFSDVESLLQATDIDVIEFASFITHPPAPESLACNATSNRSREVMEIITGIDYSAGARCTVSLLCDHRKPPVVIRRPDPKFPAALYGKRIFPDAFGHTDPSTVKYTAMSAQIQQYIATLREYTT